MYSPMPGGPTYTREGVGGSAVQSWARTVGTQRKGGGTPPHARRDDREGWPRAPHTHIKRRGEGGPYHCDALCGVCGGGGDGAQQAGQAKQVVAVQVGDEDGLNLPQSHARGTQDLVLQWEHMPSHGVGGQSGGRAGQGGTRGHQTLNWWHGHATPVSVGCRQCPPQRCTPSGNGNTAGRSPASPLPRQTARWRQTP